MPSAHCSPEIINLIWNSICFLSGPVISSKIYIQEVGLRNGRVAFGGKKWCCLQSDSSSDSPGWEVSLWMNLSHPKEWKWNVYSCTYINVLARTLERMSANGRITKRIVDCRALGEKAFHLGYDLGSDSLVTFPVSTVWKEKSRLVIYLNPYEANSFLRPKAKFLYNLLWL